MTTDLYDKTIELQRFAKGRTFLVATGTQATWLQQLHPHATLESTVQAAHDDAESGRGDLVLVGNQTFNETLAVTKNDLTFMAVNQGVLPRSILAPTTLNAKALTIAVAVRKVAFIGIGFEPNLAAANAGITVHGSDIDFLGCKFAGDDGDALQIGGGADDAAARVRILDSEFEWADRQLVFKVASGSGNLNTEIEVARCIFWNAVTRCIGRLDPAGSVQGSAFHDCNFFQGETGVEPTKYLELDGASDLNSFHDLEFDTPNQTSGKMLITAGSKWVRCWTEAGVSAAHPS